MNDNKPTLLVFDRMQYLTTGLYTFVTSDRQMSFTFDNVMAAKVFVDKFYENRIAAIFAYYHDDRFRELKACE